MSYRLFLTLTACLLLASCATTKKTAQEKAANASAAIREFRAAWIATVANINWPSKPGLSTAQQQQEADSLLDYLQAHHFNAAILQVRPQCDALYDSKLEPWSYFLTGKQGQAPDPYYDPLAYWVEEAHRRGIELHVWLNPYRAHHKDGKEITDQSIVRKRPELALFLKEGYWWLDPAQEGTREHSTAVVMDLVNRYDIDGVHFDDYFYPYPSYNGGADFPDSASWNAYVNSGGKLARGDWRREAVNLFIENLYKKIKAAKPWVKFGLSPFGIWRPGYPSSIEGFDQYNELYADARLWLNKGWIDYFTPQLYWPISRPGQSFPVLLGWWAGENKMKRHLWPGISVGRDTSLNTVNETLNQIMITRAMVPEGTGTVHWSISSDIRNTRLSKALTESVYKKDALVPASPWLDNIAPAAPEVTIARSDKLRIGWTNPGPGDVFRWVVYYQYGSISGYQVLNRDARSCELELTQTINKNTLSLVKVAVTAVDRTGNESERKEIPVQ